MSTMLAQATLYVPYWIVNKTGLWLSLKQVGMGTLPIRCATLCMHAALTTCLTTHNASCSCLANDPPVLFSYVAKVCHIHDQRAPHTVHAEIVAGH